jgi:hypothetical protein
VETDAEFYAHSKHLGQPEAIELLMKTETSKKKGQNFHIYIRLQESKNNFRRLLKKCSTDIKLS